MGKDAIRDKVAVVGMGCCKFGENWDKDPQDMIVEAAYEAYEDAGIDELDAGDVTVRVAYSSVNYKDALAATGKGRIIRRFPCIGGIDLSGTVVDSRDARFG